MDKQQPTILFDYWTATVTIARRGQTRRYSIDSMSHASRARLSRFVDRDDVLAMKWNSGRATLMIWVKDARQVNEYLKAEWKAAA